MPVFSELKGSVVNAKLWAPVLEIESQALDQIRNVASMPWVRHVSVMADCHYGKGCTIGSVVGMKGAVSAAMVGVDLGCGLAAAKTNLKASQLPDDLKAIRHQIERDVPTGFYSHKSPTTKGTWQHLFERFDQLDKRVHKLKDKASLQIGSLGGGNHFIELCLDTEQNVWLMLHSGSRNIGKELAEIHINIAKTLIHNIELPDKDLSVFLAGTPEMEAYRRDLMWAQEYALENRKAMLVLCRDALVRFFPDLKLEELIMCHHNYVSEETHFGEDLFVTRKGAISAKKDELGIIPGSMGTKSYIVRGLGNRDSLHSASHGAGRRMSRGKAKKTFTVDDLKEQTKGVECKKDSSVLDEIPGAYKSIEQVMANQSDLVEVVAELRQVLCVKG
jgi:tRNA-splicing ligase RtcB